MGLFASFRFGQLPTPQPDISFTIHGERRYCEMGRALDENFERGMNQQKCGLAEIDMSQSVCVLLTKKLVKSYAVPNSERIDLLVTPEYSSDRDLMTRLQNGSGIREGMLSGVFTRVWIYDRTYGVIGVIDRNPFWIFLDKNYQDAAFRFAAVQRQ